MQKQIIYLMSSPFRISWMNPLEVQLQVKPMWVQDGVQEISLLVKLGNWLQRQCRRWHKRINKWERSTGSTDTVGQSGRHSSDSRHDISSQAAKDFREASDYLVSHKTNTSGNITDNNASSRVDQFAASLSSAKNSYDQYTTSRTRSHEYSEMASRTESLTGQMSENLTQQLRTLFSIVLHRMLRPF
ncbi:conjugal transfer mating pair stabilization protein TraG [Klebsiella pneumoniae]|nr:conjugal transfer mating pair stabilization protein TraG [Klebsiella pneumoniae]